MSQNPAVLSCRESIVHAVRHQGATVASIFQSGISRNMKYAIMSGFCKSGHIFATYCSMIGFVSNFGTKRWPSDKANHTLLYVIK